VTGNVTNDTLNCSLYRTVRCANEGSVSDKKATKTRTTKTTKTKTNFKWTLQH